MIKQADNVIFARTEQGGIEILDIEGMACQLQCGDAGNVDALNEVMADAVDVVQRHCKITAAQNDFVTTADVEKLLKRILTTIGFRPATLRDEHNDVLPTSKNPEQPFQKNDCEREKNPVWYISRDQILSMCSDDCRRLIAEHILTIHPISLLLPKIKIDIDLSRSIKCRRSEPFFELRLLTEADALVRIVKPLLERLGDRLSRHLGIVDHIVVELFFGIGDPSSSRKSTPTQRNTSANEIVKMAIDQLDVMHDFEFRTGIRTDAYVRL